MKRKFRSVILADLVHGWMCKKSTRKERENQREKSKPTFLSKREETSLKFLTNEKSNEKEKKKKMTKSS